MLLGPGPSVMLLGSDALSPFYHGAVLNHPNITVGSGHQHDSDEDQEAGLREREPGREVTMRR